MKYVGSKNRLSKELAPIIQSYITEDTKGYLEPFVGGANMIDKIKHDNKIGCDIHKELIALLNYIKNKNNKLDQHISEEQYKKVRDNKTEYYDWYVGLVGFCCGFGAKYFNGYARSKKANGEPRDMANEAIRNLEKQRPLLKNVDFRNISFLDIDTTNIKNYVIYCDIPYKGTLKYKTDAFPYDEFYEWCKELSKNNTVLISEYSMPSDFKCVWSKDVKVGINQGEHKNRVEKLFICNHQ